MHAIRTGILTALVGSPWPAVAQTPPQRYKIDIPRQSMSGALATFAHETGLQVARLSDVGEPSVVANEVVGVYSATQALDLLLAGSGYHYRFVNDRTIAILRVPVSASTVQAAAAPSEAHSAPPPEAPKPKQNQFRLAAQLAALFAALSPAAWAQDTRATDSAATEPQEIIVTAQRRSENIQKTPVAVTAITRSTLERLQVNRVEDLTHAVPTLTVQQTTASQSSVEIAMRGGSEQSGGLATSESPVALYVDDVYQSRLSAANLALGDIERIEVLRGPQGTLYGRNTMTGAIKFITQAPDGVTRAHAQATSTSFGSWGVNAGVGGRLSDNLGGTIAAVSDQHNGWQYDTTLNRHVGDLTTIALRGALGLIDTGPFTAVLRAGYTRQHDQAQYFTPVDPNPPYEPLVAQFGASKTPLLTKADERQSSVSVNLGYDAGGVTFRSITAYQNLKDDWQLEFSGGFQGGPASPVVAGFLRTNKTTQNQITQEFQASGVGFDDKLNYIAGLFYYRESADESLSDTFGPPLFGPTFVTLLPSTLHTVSRSTAAYGQLEWALTDRVKLIGGLRFTKDKKTFDGSIQNGFGFPPTLAATHGKIDNNVVTPKASIVFQATPDLMTYATISRGYRAGGFNALAFGQPSVFGSPYEPEFMISYEAGLKAQFMDRRGTINLAGYHEKLTDLQQVVILADGTNITQNAAAATVNGLELESTFTPGAGVDFFANVALTDDKYGTLDPLSAAAIAKAKRLPLVSRVQWVAGASWRIVPDGLRGYAVIFAADHAHKSPMFTQAANTAQGLVLTSDRTNASITVESPSHRWNLKAAGTNVFNEKKYNAGYFLIPGLIATRLPAPPAMVSISVSYRY